MKKAYFVTYVGAIFSCLLTVIGINKVTKKYGQSLKEKKFSIYNLFDGVGKILTTYANSNRT
ncbi:MAG: hypothetical protein J1F23_01300 [Oscillospiraceae bacterium]|nr:hypothetical protein [Oscillospiraceae bacterium]